MKNSNPIIAIDGYSSTGKSSYAKMLAKDFGWKHVDTGAMFRAVTLYGLTNFPDKTEKINIQELINNLTNIHIDFRINPETENNDTYLNNRNVETEIRGIEVTGMVSQIAKIPEVRNFLLALQRETGKNGGIVMDGRDIGTIVFPDADLKIFITASVEERAKRRLKEFKKQNKNITLEEVQANLEQRDYIDQNREIAPLVPAKDAIIIDNTTLTKEETYQKILQLIKN